MPPMAHTATLIKESYDLYGDLETSIGSELICHFREITNLEKTANRDDLTSDAMIWFKPGTGVDIGDVVYVEGNTYRITQVIFARALGHSAVRFIKCFLEKEDGLVS